MVTSAAPAIFAGRFIFYVYGAHSADVLLQRRVFLLLFPESVLVLWWDGLFIKRYHSEECSQSPFLPSVSRSSTSTITTISMELLPT